MLPVTAATTSVSETSGADNVPLVSTAASAPAANSSESPGRNGVTTKPVSANTMANRISVHPEAVVAQQLDQVRVEMQDDVDEPVEELSSMNHFHLRVISTARAGARGHAGAARFGFAPLEQLERRVDARVARASV